MIRRFFNSGFSFVVKKEEEGLEYRDYMGYQQRLRIEQNGKKHWIFIVQVQDMDQDYDGSCYVLKSDNTEEKTTMDEWCRIRIGDHRYGIKDWT